MLERDLKRYAAYFRGWCQAFGEHESIYRDDNGVNWLTAEHQVGLVLPKTIIKPLYREVLLHKRPPPLTFHRRSVEIGSLVIGIGKKYQKQARSAMGHLLDHDEDVHVFLTSHLLYGEGSKIITFSNRKPLAIIYKEIGTMRIRVK
ncbi:MAG: hypothetical protein HKN57_03005 [Xanthomonadales bacterium]|nr:hypothetical protein [Gammaproteobacteria bacterium]MBT8052912.1 hypothetical protein [Gammaproteobacteria bacterium]NND56195.1 hypothetical protein [Xanthomonadales bacterium]NNK51559.1 hypothetical protein [Xanthomonadales bacterium]